VLRSTHEGYLSSHKKETLRRIAHQKKKKRGCPSFSLITRGSRHVSELEKGNCPNPGNRGNGRGGRLYVEGKRDHLIFEERGRAA